MLLAGPLLLLLLQALRSTGRRLTFLNFCCLSATPFTSQDGDIDMLSSDHSRSAPELKLFAEGDFLRAWGGISSLQGAFAIGKHVILRSGERQERGISAYMGSQLSGRVLATFVNGNLVFEDGKTHSCGMSHVADCKGYSKFDHSKFDHSKFDHSKFDHSKKNEKESRKVAKSIARSKNQKESNLGSRLMKKVAVEKEKLLNSAPKKYLPIVASIEQYSEIETMSFEEAMGRLKAYEERLKSHDERSNGDGVGIAASFLKVEKVGEEVLVRGERRTWKKLRSSFKCEV
ncbi:allantoinase isoform X2 [Tanacetum coccineum]